MKKINFYQKPCFFTFALIVSLLDAPLEFCAGNSASSENVKVENISVENVNVNVSLQTDTSQKEKRKKKGKAKKKMNQTKLVSVPESTWGATGIRLAVEENAVKIEYDCADGEIEQSLKVDEQGNFTANGVHIRQKGGPIREDSPPPRQPARYQGKISGDKMTLKVTLTENGEVIGTFTLERGKTPQMHRCY